MQSQYHHQTQQGSMQNNHSYNSHAHRQAPAQQGGYAPQDQHHAAQGQHQKEQTKNFLQVKTHGGKAAFEFSPDKTKDGWSTIRLEGASKLNNNTKQYDWKNKITIQITKNELPIITAVLLGFMPSCEFGNHGQTNKGFALINQGKSFFFKIFEPGENKRMYVCPVPLVEANLMGTLALAQHASNFPSLNSDSALTAIRSLASQMNKAGVMPLAKT